jgi:hypothetical protein
LQIRAIGFEKCYRGEATRNTGKWRIADPGAKQTRSINNIN